MTQAELTSDPGTRSAYPRDIPDLIPEAETMMEAAGRIPGRNALMRELHIGPEKAKVLRSVLISRSPDVPSSDAGPGYDSDTGAYPLVPAPEYPGTPTPPVETAAPATETKKRPGAWPLGLLVLPAFVALWSGWVGLGELTGFGVVHPFPGMPWGLDHVQINSAITLPIGVETYAAYAMRVWLSPAVSARTRRFAKWSVVGAFLIGGAGQIAYHLMTAMGITRAPWEIVTGVALLPLIVAFLGVGLAHLVHTDVPAPSEQPV